MWNLFVNLERFVLSVKAPLKKSMLFADELFKISFLLFTTFPVIQNIRSPAALIFIVQNAFLAKSLRAGNYNLWSRHHWRMLLHRKLSVAYLASVTFTCNGSTFRNPYKVFLIPHPTRLHSKFNPHPSIKCGYRQPAQVNSTRRSLVRTSSLILCMRLSPSRPETSRGQPSNCPHFFSKTC